MKIYAMTDGLPAGLGYIDLDAVRESGYTAGYASGYSDGYDSVECEDASYFAIEVVSGGTIAWDNNQSSYDDDSSFCYLKYRINGGEWGTLVNNIKHEPEGVASAFTVSAGDVVEFGTNGNSVNWDMTRSTDKHYRFVFSQEMKCKLEGNIMSLIYPEGVFETATEFPHDESGYEKTNWFDGLFSREEGLGDAIIDAGNLLLPATALTNSCYRNMFKGCASLVTPPELPATTLAHSCYRQMFHGCSSLTTTPELPAMALAESCYEGMFHGCSSLTTAPELPATTLAPYCYRWMLERCNFTTAPELPATTLATGCYFWMFSYCYNLVEAPELPAMTLAEECYVGMFQFCGLTEAPELPATTLAKGCYRNMFVACSGLTEAPELPATTLAESCYEKMFAGCTALEKSPVLPASVLVTACYKNMFGGCTNLAEVKCLATDISATDCTYYWLAPVSNTGTFYKHPSTTWPTGQSGIPNGWTVVDAS